MYVLLLIFQVDAYYIAWMNLDLAFIRAGGMLSTTSEIFNNGFSPEEISLKESSLHFYLHY
jgi:hypothetical protein